MAGGVGRRVGDMETGRHGDEESTLSPHLPISPSPKKIGILGGTFDPPHKGHLLLGQAALAQLHLDSVLFLPVGDPTHKSRKDMTPVAQRIAMTALAIADHPGFMLDLTDALRAEPHYTSTLLPLMLDKHPGAELWLVIGGDSLRDFGKWNEPERILEMVRLAVLPRPGAGIDWEALEVDFPDIRSRVDMLDGATLDLSSTRLRKMEDDDAREPHLPDAVMRYIDHSDLYD